MNSDNVAARLRKFEGSVDHMYQCTGGKVTVGVGHAIETVDEACMMPFQNHDAVEFDYHSVAKADPDQVASAYAACCVSWMADGDIDRLLYQDITIYQAALEEALPNFDLYPETAQEALFDMGFNLGIAGLLKFEKMLAAVDRGDWDTASAECHRKGIPEERNEETAGLFLDCKAA